MIRTAGPSDYDASSPYQEGDLELVIESLGEERAGKVLQTMPGGFIAAVRAACKSATGLTYVRIVIYSPKKVPR